MAGTFPCPHCGASYPIKPVLVDRPVRCTTCKNVFALRANGVADKVGGDEPAAPQQAAAPPQPPAPAPAAKKPSAADKAAAARAAMKAPGAPAAPTPSNKPSPVPKTAQGTAQKAAQARSAAPKPPASGSAPQPAAEQAEQKSTSARQKKQRTGRQLKGKHAEIRKTMAANLTAAASKALESESVKREGARERKKSTTQRRKKGGAGESAGVGDIGPAVLTNYGDREARNNRMWLIGSLVALVIISIGVFTMIQPNRFNGVLIQFGQSKEGWRGARRVANHQALAWLFDANTAVILNADKGEIGSSRSINLAAASSAISTFMTDRIYLPDSDIWIPSGDLETVQSIMASESDPEKIAETMRIQNVTAASSSELSAALSTNGMAPNDIELLMYLLTGATDEQGNNFIRKRMASGDIPQSLDIVEFSGTDGRQLRLESMNQTEVIEGVRYRGRLMRFGTPWVGQFEGDDRALGAWRVLDMQVPDEETKAYPAGRGY